MSWISSLWANGPGSTDTGRGTLYARVRHSLVGGLRPPTPPRADTLLLDGGAARMHTGHTSRSRLCMPFVGGGAPPPPRPPERTPGVWMGEPQTHTGHTARSRPCMSFVTGSRPPPSGHPKYGAGSHVLFLGLRPQANSQLCPVFRCPLGGVWGGGAPPPAKDMHGLEP